MEPQSQIITAWAAAVASLLTVAGKFVYDYMKTKQVVTTKTDLKQQKMDQKDLDYLFGKYKELTENLEESVNEARSEFQKLQIEHMSCREENARLQVRITFLEEKMKSMENKISTIDTPPVKKPNNLG